jgi:hypothetical protein
MFFLYIYIEREREREKNILTNKCVSVRERINKQKKYISNMTLIKTLI